MGFLIRKVRRQLIPAADDLNAFDLWSEDLLKAKFPTWISQGADFPVHNDVLTALSIETSKQPCVYLNSDYKYIAIVKLHKPFDVTEQC